MRVEQAGAGGPGPRSYKDVALANLPPDSHKGPPPNPHVLELEASLRDLLARHPKGVSLTQARRFCPLLLHPDVLKDHPSVRHLLASMPKVVQLRGVGVQTRILPPIP